MFVTKKKLTKEQASVLIFDAVFGRVMDILHNKDKRGLSNIDDGRIAADFLSIYLFIFWEVFQFLVDNEVKEEIFEKVDELIKKMIIRLFGISMKVARDMMSYVYKLQLEYFDCLRKFEGRGDEVCKWEIAKCAARDIMEGDEGDGDREERFITYNSLVYEEMTTYLSLDNERLKEYTLI